MSVQKTVIAIVSALVLMPVYAEQDDSVAVPDGELSRAVPPSAMEQRVREYREAFDRRMQQPALENTEIDQRRQTDLEQYLKRTEAWSNQQEEQRELARKWREARDKYNEVRMETWLKKQEETQQRAVRRHEALRNRAEEQHNYLVKHHEEMLEKALQEKMDFANRHEEMRKTAEERRRKVTAFRSTMQGMTAKERREYMEQHRDELFGSGSRQRSLARPVPQPFGGMRSRPPQVPAQGALN
jgi:chromosome segregation ATPase